MTEPIQFYGSLVLLVLLLAAVIACGLKMHAIEQQMGVKWLVRMKFLVFKYWLANKLIVAGRKMQGL